MLIAMSPMWLGACLLWIKTNEKRDYFDILINSIQNGELMIYCTALLAPVFYITISDKHPIRFFPNKLSSVITAIAILMVTAAVYAHQRSGSLYKQELIFNLSVFLFFTSLLILFVTKVYNNSRFSTYMDIAQQEKKLFVST